jgi:hypothetical protein
MTSVLGFRSLIVQAWTTSPLTNSPWDPIVWVEVSAKAIGAPMPTAPEAATVAANAAVIAVIFNVVHSWLVRTGGIPRIGIITLAKLAGRCVFGDTGCLVVLLN